MTYVIYEIYTNIRCVHGLDGNPGPCEVLCVNKPLPILFCKLLYKTSWAYSILPTYIYSLDMIISNSCLEFLSFCGT